MAVIKVACSKCGQRVSGDERFYGTTVQCPICSAKIEFPSAPDEEKAKTEAGSPSDLGSLPTAFEDAPAQQAEPGYSGVPQQPVQPMPSAYPPHGYGQPGPGNVIPMGEPPGAVSARKSSDSSAGMVPTFVLISGIVAAVTVPCGGAILFGPLTIILGHISLIRMNANRETEGKGKATIGLVLGYVSLLLLLITVVLVKAFWPQLQGAFGSEEGAP